MRYLAIDLGDKRTGLAVGDSGTGLVTPVAVLEIPRSTREDDLLAAILHAADEHGGETLVIGLPINMDDTEGARARMVRQFAEKLGARSNRSIEFQDERLTSFAADERMARSGRTRRQKKAVRDALAAAAILEDFLARSAGSDESA